MISVVCFSISIVFYSVYILFGELLQHFSVGCCFAFDLSGPLYYSIQINQDLTNDFICARSPDHIFNTTSGEPNFTQILLSATQNAVATVTDA